MIPVAGSAYTYGYATLGEIFAWIIGWDLVLEYAFGAATVCSGWSGYVLSLGQDFGLRLPPELAGTPGSTFVLYNGHWEFLGRVAEQAAQLGIDPATLPQRHGVFNLVAFLGIMFVTTILVIGIKESANFNSVIVAVKLVVLVIFLGHRRLDAPASSGAAAASTGIRSCRRTLARSASSAGRAYCAAPASSSSPTSASTPSRPPRRRPRTPSATCPSASSARW